MSLDIAEGVLRCDAEGCDSTTEIPIRLRQYYDDAILELRNESSAAGWVFISSKTYDKHYCPQCAEKYIGPKNGTPAG